MEFDPKVLQKVCVVLCELQGGAAMTYGLISNTTFSYSNVVGPVDEISFYGHPILYLAPSVYGHPHVSLPRKLIS